MCNCHPDDQWSSVMDRPNLALINWRYVCDGYSVRRSRTSTRRCLPGPMRLPATCKRIWARCKATEARSKSISAACVDHSRSRSSARRPGKGLRYEERLGLEALDLAGTGHGHLVFLGQLFHAKDGDDILQVFIALQNALHRARHRVVLLPHHPWVEDARGGVQRVHGRIDAQLGDLPR